MNDNGLIYLDNAATTACAPEVIDVMLPFFGKHFANASSVDHSAGTFARRAVEDSRLSIATLLGAQPEDVIFTSGSTEANNLVLSVDNPILTTRIEHPSILEPFARRKHTDDDLIPTDSNGRIDCGWLSDKLRSRTRTSVVSIIATNNETGSEQDVQLIGTIAAEGRAILHLDATQAIGTREFSLKDHPIAALSLSAHKIYGPKGVGALVASSAVRRLIVPMTRGGGQERGLRSGTLNVPAIVGFGTAARLIAGNITQHRNHLSNLRRTFLEIINLQLPDTAIETISGDLSAPHILSLRFKGINSRALLGTVSSNLAFSLGAACSTNKSEPSHVLLALGLAKSDIMQTVRFSFSRYQQIAEIKRAASLVVKAVSDLRSLAFKG